MNFIKTIRAQSKITKFLWVGLLVVWTAAVMADDMSGAFMALTVYVVSLLPIAFSRYAGIIIPKYFMAGVVFFIIATLFLGEVFNFYNRFWWWDVFLHSGSAVGFGLIGFLIVFGLIGGERNNNAAWVVAILTFAFAVTIGTIWEIFEFAMDQIFGMNMQKSGLIDTMWDLIVDSLGALTAAISGWYFMRRQRGLGLFTGVLAKFVKDNPRLFKRFSSREGSSRLNDVDNAVDPVPNNRDEVKLRK